MYKDKLYDILMCDDIVSSINNNLDYLFDVIPELKSMVGFDHRHPHHHLDVWNHTLLALSYSKSDFYIRLVLLLHDIGKPFSYQDSEVRHFKGHPEVSCKMAFYILLRLGFNNDEISKVCYLIKEHDNPISDKEIYDMYDISLMKFKIQCCDALAHNPSKLDKRIKYLFSIYDKINAIDGKNKCRKFVK